MSIQNGRSASPELHIESRYITNVGTHIHRLMKTMIPFTSNFRSNVSGRRCTLHSSEYGHSCIKGSSNIQTTRLFWCCAAAKVQRVFRVKEQASWQSAPEGQLQQRPQACLNRGRGENEDICKTAEPVVLLFSALGRRRASESLRGLRNHLHLKAVFVSPDSRANSA